VKYAIQKVPLFIVSDYKLYFKSMIKYHLVLDDAVPWVCFI